MSLFSSSFHSSVKMPLNSLSAENRPPPPPSSTPNLAIFDARLKKIGVDTPGPGLAPAFVTRTSLHVIYTARRSSLASISSRGDLCNLFPMQVQRLLLTCSRHIHSTVRTAMALRFDGRVALVTGAGGGTRRLGN